MGKPEIFMKLFKVLWKHAAAAFAGYEAHEMVDKMSSDGKQVTPYVFQPSVAEANDDEHDENNIIIILLAILLIIYVFYALMKFVKYIGDHAEVRYRQEKI